MPSVSAASSASRSVPVGVVHADVASATGVQSSPCPCPSPSLLLLLRLGARGQIQLEAMLHDSKYEPSLHVCTAVEEE